jgi:nitrite reductase (NADH) large subunit
VKRYVIVGNGVAGTTAAEHIRKNDKAGEIIVLTDEDLPFYYRIRLNEYLCGDIDEQDLIAKKNTWYDDRKIQLQTGVRVTHTDSDKRLLTTQNNDEIYYDSLLIATGSKCFVPPIKGTGKKGIFTFRTVEDARQIMSFCKDKENITIIGGGLLGLETGYALRKREKQVTVVEFFPRLLPRQLDIKGAERLTKRMEDMGLSFRLGVSTNEILGDVSVESVVLSNQEKIPSEMVIISAGIRPNLELAESLGLQCNKGISVDSTLRTSRPEVFAAGDVAEYEQTMYGVWPAAMQQGKVAGINMAGGSESYQGSVMANKLKVVGIELASAGEIDVENRCNSKIEETETVYKKIVIDDGHIIGCILLGDTSNFNTITRAIAEKTAIENVTL